MEEENERLKKKKAAVCEQQKFLEQIRSEKNINNIFIGGIPNEMEIGGNRVTDANAIVNHILKFVNPEIQPHDYKTLKNFESRQGHDRYSTKITCYSQNIKKKIFEGCRNFKDLSSESPLKKVFLKNEDTPLQ